MSGDSVAAVVVTFNRKRLLIECLDALLSQTRPLNHIIIVDNASSDGTAGLLAEGGYIANPSVTYLGLPKNSGGAGGFHAGMKLGYDTGCDWLWVMDDDAEPTPDALKILSEDFHSMGVVSLACLKVDVDGNPLVGHRGWFERERLTWRAIRPIDAGNLAGDVLIDHASFVGLCVARRAITDIGLPRSDFFIHYDDVEFCMRLSTVGTMILKTKSIIVHKEASIGNETVGRFFGRPSLRDRYEGLWLKYFGIRNYIWIARSQHGAFDVLALAVPFLFRKCVGILLYDDHKVRRIRFYASAVLAGWFGTFDNDRPKEILYGRP